MEVIEVVGIRDVNFTDKSNRTISGISIYYLCEDDNVDGRMCGKLFVSKERAQNLAFIPEVGDTVEVSYDRFGKPASFKKI